MKQKTKDIKLKRLCDNCGEECYLLTDMIAENGQEISFCEQCLRDSE